MSESFESLTAKGRPYLVEYLESHGVEFTKRGKFSCIHPDHPDTDPSANIIPTSNGEEFNCFGCGAHGDIYAAAHYLEDKPLIGPGFMSENLEYVLTKMGVEHEKVELTEEQVNKLKFHKLHQAVVNTMLEEDEDGDFIHLDLTYADERGWGKEICKKLIVGSVRDFKKFSESVQAKTSLNLAAIEDMDITKDLFGPKKLTHAIRDHTGSAVGFVARTIGWKKGSSLPKFKNTSEFKNPYYKKGRLLYGLDDVRKLTGLRLDIFEGYGDLVTARQAGLKTCAAMGGTAFTTDHADLLYGLGFRHVNLVFDDDKTGRNLSEANIKKFSGYSGLKVTVMYLPDLGDEEGQNDPDFFIRTRGLEVYRKIRTVGAFEFKLRQHELIPESDEAISFAKETCRLILNEENRIERARMVKALSAATGVDRKDLEDEIERVESTELASITGRLQKALKNVRDPDQLSDILDKARGNLQKTSSTKEDRYQMSIGQSLEAWQGIFQGMEIQKAGMHGWITGYDVLDQMLDGIAKPSSGGICYGIAGAPQHGKSAAMLNIGLRVAQRNPDATVLYWAIDDCCNSIAYKLVAILSGVSIKKVRRMYTPNEEEELAIQKAKAEVMRLIEEGRLVFKDDAFGRSKAKAESWIKYMQDEYQRDILFCVDSLHNVSGGQDMRTKLIETSTWLKAMCAKMPLSAIATLEMVKDRGQEKPTLQKISETAKIEFDFDAVAVAWNETQGKYGDMDLVTAKWGEAGDWKPIIELDWQKNKSAAGEKGPIYFHLDPYTTAFNNATRTIEGLEPSKPLISDMGKGSTVMIENQKDIKGGLVASKPKTGPKVTLRTTSKTT